MFNKFIVKVTFTLNSFCFRLSFTFSHILLLFNIAAMLFIHLILRTNVGTESGSVKKEHKDLAYI